MRFLLQNVHFVSDIWKLLIRKLSYKDFLSKMVLQQIFNLAMFF